MWPFIIGGGLLLLLTSKSDDSKSDGGGGGGETYPTDIKSYSWYGVAEKGSDLGVGKKVAGRVFSKAQLEIVEAELETIVTTALASGKDPMGAVLEHFNSAVEKAASVTGTIVGRGTGLKSVSEMAADDHFWIMKIDKVNTSGAASTPKVGDLVALG